MPDFSASGVIDLPATTAESLTHGDPRVIGWIKEWREEADLINRSDPSYEIIERAQQYIVGEQLTSEHRRLRYLPQVTVNETRKSMQAHVSALTDLKPLAGWKSFNPACKAAADILNQYLISEWVTTFMDLELGDCVKYSLAAGTGDLVVDWDQHAPFGGQHVLSARDPRDTLPLRPSLTRSPQLWEGVQFREEHTVNVLRGMYPTKAHLFRPSSEVALGRVMGRLRQGLSRILSPADPLDSLNQPHGSTRRRVPGRIVLYRSYFRDRTRNLTGKPIPMGDGAANWSYAVPDQGLLYPRGRLIVATDDALLYDGPNTYWHGLYPFCRLKLWSVPWQFLGIPLMNDLLPLQDAINDTVHDIRLGIRQWMDPDVIYNRNAVSESTMRLLDPRKPGKRIKTNPGFGDPYKKDDGPNPQIIQQAIEMWDKLTQKFSDMAGTANLSALLQLRQLPSADTIQKYYEALTPEIRQEARQVEAFLRDLSEMVKTNYFQFLPSTKRRMILGDQSLMLNDFDFDPGNMVPAMQPSDQGYTPELDVNLTNRDQRAIYSSKQLVFVVAPNSVLAIDAQEQKMMKFQLARMGYLDIQTLMETLEIGNFGTFPAIPLPPIDKVPPEVMPGLMLQMAQPGVIQGMLAGMAPPQFTEPQTGRTFLLNPMNGQILELRTPITILERLTAQNMMGIGMTNNPAGRKSSGQEPPKQETKSDGRSTVTESSH